MKNIIIALILFLFLYASNAIPQESKGSFGIFSGITLNTNSYSYDDKNNYLDTSYTSKIKTSFSVGMLVMYDFVRNFGIRMQGQYTKKGGKKNFQIYTGTTLVERAYNNSINYFQFSLLPQFNLPFSEKDYENKVYLNAGGYISFLIGAKEYITDDQEAEQEKDIKESLKASDAGLIFGIGIIAGHFILDVRYDLGLTDIANEALAKDFLKIKNRSINISVGYKGGF